MTIEKLKQSEPIFGSWYVESKIAEGRSSKVFKVSRIENGESEYMCLKVIKFPRSNTEVSNAIASEKYQTVDEYLSALQKEVSLNMEKMLELQGNDNIVRFADFGILKENSCFYVVMLMELLTPLSDYLKADSIKPKEVIKIGWNLCGALEGFRQAGIMHHNIKPDNIYVDERGNYKLGDFGISEIGETKLEPGGYSAPELFAGAGVDSASDIYSLGVVLYKLLNNNRGPFLPQFPAPISLQDREQATVKRLRGDLFPTPSGADYNLAKIIFKATSFKPLDRYETPFLMRRDLEMYIKALAASPAQPQNSAAVKTQHVAAQAPHRPRPDGAESVTAEDKNDFALAFTDDEADEEPKPEKKWYFIIMALVIVLALVIGLVVKGASDRNKDIPSTEITTTEATTVTTTAVTTTETTTTEVTTTEETTTQETTTEVLTTEATTTEATTEETTTEVTTTEVTTTESTTTAVDSDESDEPILVGSANVAGTENEDGKIYMNLDNYAILHSLPDTEGKEIVLEISNDLGSQVQINDDVYLYMMIGDVTVQRVTPTASIEEGDDGTYVCTVTIHDEDFYYEPEQYQYYLCFEEGAIESDSSVILPLQIAV